MFAVRHADSPFCIEKGYVIMTTCGIAREGLVEIFRNRGAVVRMLTAQDVEEIYGLRVLLEGDAIFHGVKRIDDETLARAELVHRLLGEAHRARRGGAHGGARVVLVRHGIHAQRPGFYDIFSCDPYGRTLDWMHRNDRRRHVDLACKPAPG
ncbi:hypothetical protein [Paraburkholderia silvatlantica]|uniref:hypothetical protein n=1 Tax=Paraburkholderia silvatlantica TaxID=321895 RepID=UPI003750927F